MGSALWAGISGLNASSKQMDVIANNIANVNTIGYKAGKIFFADVLSQSISGGSSGSMQVGRGVAVTEVGTLFGSGSFETTGNATDVAIDGDGFFMVNDSNGATYYTRAGAFHLDNNGNLVDTNGYKLQGFNFFGSTTGRISDISLRNVQSAPQVTSTFSAGVNLNSETRTGDTYTTTQTVYDSLGARHSLGLTFQKTEKNGYWGVQSSLDGSDAITQDYYGLVFDTNGVLHSLYTATCGASPVNHSGGGTGTVDSVIVNKRGQLYQNGVITLTRGANENAWTITSPEYTNLNYRLGESDIDDIIAIDLDGEGGTDITIAISPIGWANGDNFTLTIVQNEISPVDFSVRFHNSDGTLPNGATIGNRGVITWDIAGTSALTVTNYASTSVIKSLKNDGYASGLLKSLSIRGDGVISGFFTNGQTSDLAQIVLADFDNPWGLKKMGSNLFAETVRSGPAVRNVPGASGMGELASNSLEMSNTDVATEFINMITAQKAYQASARVITTQDQMLSELMNIKR